MGVNIDYFLKLTDAIANKNQSGNSITIAQKNIFANQAQMVKFEADRNIYISTGELTEYLKSFLKKITKQVPPTGELAMPSDLQHTAAMRMYYQRPDGKSVEITVKEVKDVSWGDIQISSLLRPIPRFSKYMEFGRTFRLAPKNIGTIYLDYLRTPVKPEWKYTTVNNRPVYNPLLSVDFEWAESFCNEIAGIYLGFIGINLQFTELQNFAQAFKNESKAQL